MLAWLRSLFAREPVAVVCNVTNGRESYRLTAPAAIAMQMAPDEYRRLTELVTAVAEKRQQWASLPVFCRLDIVSHRPEYDPPTAGELGL